MSPLLLTAYHDRFQLMKEIIRLDSTTLYASCNKMNNALHYAIEHRNDEMVKYLLSCDAENNLLKKEINIRGQKPFDLDTKKLFTSYQLHLWEQCATLTID